MPINELDMKRAKNTKSFSNEEAVLNYIRFKGVLKAVPLCQITDTVLQEYLRINRTSKYLLLSIPTEFLTPDMVVDFIKLNMKRKDWIIYIPRTVLTGKICELYYNQFQSLKFMDKDIIPRTVAEKHFDKTKDLEFIPERYITANMVNDYFQNCGTLKFIPEEFITEDMCRIYFQCRKTIKYIPERFITEDMCRIYFQRRGTIKYIPEKFLTEDMCRIYFQCRGTINYIPEKFLTKDMCLSYFNGYNLRTIPKRFRTKEMYEEYFKKTYLLAGIPVEFITVDMLKEYIKNKKGKISIAILDAEKLNFFIENPEYSNCLEKSAFEYLLAAELVNALNEKITIPEILKKYNIDMNALFAALEYVNNKYVCQVRDLIISQMNEEEEYKYTIKMTEKVDYLRELIVSLGEFETDLSKEQRMTFVYNYFNHEPYVSLEALFKWMVKNEYQKNKDLACFFAEHLGMQATPINFGDCKEVKESKARMFRNKKWYKRYDVNAVFESNLKMKMGSQTLEKEDVEKIIDIMQYKKIPIYSCLVNEAIKWYANGDTELNSFGDYLKEFAVNGEISKYPKKKVLGL